MRRLPCGRARLHVPPQPRPAAGVYAHGHAVELALLLARCVRLVLRRLHVVRPPSPGARVPGDRCPAALRWSLAAPTRQLHDTWRLLHAGTVTCVQARQATFRHRVQQLEHRGPHPRLLAGGWDDRGCPPVRAAAEAAGKVTGAPPEAPWPCRRGATESSCAASRPLPVLQAGSDCSGASRAAAGFRPCGPCGPRLSHTGRQRPVDLVEPEQHGVRVRCSLAEEQHALLRSAELEHRAHA
mmetsp:Transcript_30093/g.76485  ORF Transcript_30093/g.76485 Transcript_30093/m.76485 type:complete len:240 (-) Transcript_30093:542-1261(-)